MGSEDGEIVREFLAESYDNLDRLDRDLVELERQAASRELLAAVFRTIHTIKGVAGALAFGRLESLTHAGENVLSRLRDGDLPMTPPIAEALLRMVDCVRALLAGIERSGNDADESIDVDDVVSALRALTDSTPDVTSPVVTPAVQRAVPPAPRAEGWDGVERRRGYDTSVRVEVELLDTLVRVAADVSRTGEAIQQEVEAARAANLVPIARRLNLLAGELADIVGKARMQPIGDVWGKMPRVVRDLADQLGRRVRLEMEGQDTELDRSLLEAVKDPLFHLVRNAIDHGIEPPAERVDRGKPAEGVVSLRAHRHRGQVVVEITDDGRGLDTTRIRTVAARRGVVAPDRLAGMTEREIWELIFRPGFSTAETVTNVSGRGVGMDVVRTNVERIGGAVELSGRFGVGTTVRLRMPQNGALAPTPLVEITTPVRS